MTRETRDGPATTVGTGSLVTGDLQEGGDCRGREETMDHLECRDHRDPW